MTGSDHKDVSILIFKVGGDIPDFVRYRNLVGSKKQEYITEQRTIPNNLDYKRGFITLYFARQSNITDEKVFEISKNDFDKETPFYDKVRLELKIFGERNEVEVFNLRRMNVANSKLRGVEYVVRPLQYFRPLKKTMSSTSGDSSSGGGY